MKPKSVQKLRKLSRKKRKEMADVKRKEYFVKIANEAGRLTQPKPLDKHWVPKLDNFVHDLIETNYLDAHLIRQASLQFGRMLLKTLNNGKEVRNGKTHTRPVGLE